MSSEQEKIAALEQKLTAASDRLQHKPSNKVSNIAFRLLADLCAGLCVGFIIGYNLDIRFDTKPFFSSILIILGTASGFYNFYKFEFKKVLEKT